jgi:DNA polymerase-4
MNAASPTRHLILHVDVDAFFASVEQLLIPLLRGRPVVVGSGCIASCSYEARRFGLSAGMPLSQARRLCPSAVVLAGDQPIYHCFAEHVWEVCREFACGLETYLDEAYGDAGGMEALHGDPPTLGRKLQAEVRRRVGLPVSVGLAANHMLAKVASAAGKPGGVVWIAPGREEAFLADLPARRLPGVGRKTAALLDEMNVRTVADLRRLPRRLLRDLLGVRGEQLYDRCRGRDERTLRADRPPRTISRETTFHQPTCEPGEIRGMLQYLLERAMRDLRRRGLLAGAVELTARYDDWRRIAGRRTLAAPTGMDEEVLAAVMALLGRLYRRRVALRHVGVVLSNFAPAAAEGRLLEPETRARRRQLHSTVDAIRDRWGHAAVVTGGSVDLLDRLERNDYGFVLRTPSLTK